MAKAKKKTKKSARLDWLVRSIGKIIAGRDGLARQAEKQYVPNLQKKTIMTWTIPNINILRERDAIEVANIVFTQSRDTHRIQRVLDGILDFCFDPAMLILYKKLCRY